MMAASVACGRPSNNGVQEQHRRDQQHRDDDPREPGTNTGGGGHGAARETGVDREALQQPGPPRSPPQGDTPGSGRSRSLGSSASRGGRAMRLCERDEGEREHAAGQRTDLAEADVRDLDARQSRRYVRDHGNAMGGEVERAAAGDGGSRHHERPGNAWREPAEPEQGDERHSSDEGGPPAGLVERAEDAPDRLRDVAALDRDPEEVRDLADDDHDPDAADEAEDHRPGEELRHEPESQRSGQEQGHAGEHRERCEKHRVLLAREGRRDRDQRSGGGDGDRGARPHLELTAGAEDGVQHPGCEGREETGLRWRAGERGIRNRLRHQHGPDGGRGQQVAPEPRPLVPRQPSGDRDVARESRSLTHPHLPFATPNMRWLGTSAAGLPGSEHRVFAILDKESVVPLASDYPFLDVLWSMIIFFVFIIWIWLLITVFADVFRRRDIGGGMKAVWLIFVILLPYLGVFIYLIAEHDGMADRSMAQMQQAKAQQDEYIKSVAGTSATDQIAQAKGLLDSGTISQAEFDALKAKALS